jgi:hypothetical protein
MFPSYSSRMIGIHRQTTIKERKEFMVVMIHLMQRMAYGADLGALILGVVGGIVQIDLGILPPRNP